MSDNKTPINSVIEELEELLNQAIQNKECSYSIEGKNCFRGKEEAFTEAIQTLKSHLALEEEAIKEAFVQGAEIGEMFNNENRAFTTDANDYFNQKFKPE